MKRTIDDLIKTEYKKYQEECKKPQSFFDWASMYRHNTIESLKCQLKLWEQYKPKLKVVIKVKRKNK